MGRQQTILVPVYAQGGAYPGYSQGMYPYGGGYAGYPGYGGAGGMMMNPCCGGVGGAQYGGTQMMMPNRESNAKKFLRGATEGVFMGSIGMLGFKK